MAKKPRVERLIECPKCKRNMKPWILEEREAITFVKPPIPARLFVRCSASKCGQRFYMMRDRAEAA